MESSLTESLVDIPHELLRMSSMEISMLKNNVWPAESQIPPYYANINAVLLFKTLPSEEKLAEMVKSSLLMFMRFRSKGHQDGTWTVLALADIDMKYHITTEAACDATALSAAVDRVVRQNFDEEQPLWQIHRLPVRQSSGDDLHALVIRIHHCIGDGFHLSRVLDEVCTLADGSKPDLKGAQKKFAAPVEGARKGFCQRVWSKTCQAARRLLGVIPAFLSNATASKKKLSNATWHLPEDLRRAGTFAAGERRSVLLPPFSLRYVQDCKNALGVSVNDVLMGVTAGAIRRLCEERNDPIFTPGQRSQAAFNALVPVALPRFFPESQDKRDRLTNNWCFCSASLAVCEAGVLDRVRATSREMGRLKNSMRPVVGMWMINKLVPRMPLALSQQTAKELFACHSCVFSNVPGPQEQLFMCGEALEGIQAVFNNAVPQFLLLSYKGQIFMNLTADPAVITNLDGFTDCFLKELQTLGDSCGVDKSGIGF